MALGIDKVDDDEYEISVQLIDPNEISSNTPSSGRTPVVTYNTKGESVYEAGKKLTTLTPRLPYYAHTQVIVIGEELATEGIRGSLDLFTRNVETRGDFNLLIARNSTAKDILNVLTPLEHVPANKIINSMKGTEKAWGSIHSVILDDFVNLLNNNSKSAVLPAIEIKGQKKLGIGKTNVEKIDTPVLLQYSGMAIFNEDRLVGILSDEESRYFSYLNNKMQSTTEVISCPKEGVLSTEITKSVAKTTGKFESGIPVMNVSINIEQNVAEVQCQIDLTKNSTIQKINDKTRDLIKDKTEQLILTIQEKYRTDVFGYGEILHRSDPEEWSNIKNDWETLFQDLKVNVEVNVTTQGVGNIMNKS